MLCVAAAFAGLFVGSKYRKAWRRWRVRRSSSGGGGGGGVTRYSMRWWYWTHEGRKTWRKCKAKGKSSKYWKRHKCGKRTKAERYSRWWWWSSEGKDVWKKCKAKGKKSKYWKKNLCSDGR